MRTAAEWVGRILVDLRLPIIKQSDKVRAEMQVLSIRKEGAEEMRERFKRLAGMRFSGWRGLAEVLLAIDALPLPGDVEAEAPSG